MNKAMTFDGKELKTIEWENDSYKLISTHVGGYIERIPITALDEKNIDMWCNEEGKLIGLEPSIALTHNGDIVDMIMGNVVLTKTDGNGETISLTDDDIDFVKKYFKSLMWLLCNKGLVLAMPY